MLKGLAILVALPLFGGGIAGLAQAWDLARTAAASAATLRAELGLHNDVLPGLARDGGLAAAAILAALSLIMLGLSVLLLHAVMQPAPPRPQRPLVLRTPAPDDGPDGRLDDDTIDRLKRRGGA